MHNERLNLFLQKKMMTATQLMKDVAQPTEEMAERASRWRTGLSSICWKKTVQWEEHQGVCKTKTKSRSMLKDKETKTRAGLFYFKDHYEHRVSPPARRSKSDGHTRTPCASLLSVLSCIHPPTSSPSRDLHQETKPHEVTVLNWSKKVSWL